MRAKRSRYTVNKVYIIICRSCNEDITRSLSGEEPGTRGEAEEFIAEHERVFHTPHVL